MFKFTSFSKTFTNISFFPFILAWNFNEFFKCLFNILINKIFTNIFFINSFVELESWNSGIWNGEFHKIMKLKFICIFFVRKCLLTI
jgi:hypothetical protein